MPRCRDGEAAMTGLDSVAAPATAGGDISPRSAAPNSEAGVSSARAEAAMVKSHAPQLSRLFIRFV